MNSVFRYGNSGMWCVSGKIWSEGIPGIPPSETEWREMGLSHPLKKNSHYFHREEDIIFLGPAAIFISVCSKKRLHSCTVIFSIV